MLLDEKSYNAHMSEPTHEEKYIVIPSGTMLNFGKHEDSDYIVLGANTHALVVGPTEDHAIPVQIMLSNDEWSTEALFYHQPEV